MLAFHFFQHRLLRNEAQSTTKSNTTSDHNILTKKNKQTNKAKCETSPQAYPHGRKALKTFTTPVN